MSKSKISSDLFAKWLSDKIFLYHIPVWSMAKDLHMAPKTIYRHMNANNNPTFAHVIAYCWYLNTYFGKDENPLEVWRLVE